MGTSEVTERGRVRANLNAFARLGVAENGSPSAKTQSDGNVKSHAKNGYARVTHRYDKSGHYLVRVERTDKQDRCAVTYVYVRVE